MKKFPFTIGAVVLLVLSFGAFLFVPPGGDLISPQGDYFLGQAMGGIFILAIIFDFSRRK